MEQIIIESDSLVTIKAINGEINSPRLFGNVVEDINIMAKTVTNINFVYCSRSTNM